MTDEQLKSVVESILDARDRRSPQPEPAREKSLRDVLTPPMQFLVLLVAIAGPAAAAVSSVAAYVSKINGIGDAQKKDEGIMNDLASKESLEKMRTEVEAEMKQQVNAAMDDRLGPRYGAGWNHGR